MQQFRACFAELADPRTGNAQRHDLLEILLIALAGVLAGAESCVDMAAFGRAKESFLRRFLALPGGIPSHDTFSRVFRLLDPAGFEACFGRFVAAFSARVDQVVAIDGKPARRSFDRCTGRDPLHLVSAWACEQQLVLGQRNAEGGEITALPELLALPCLEGCTVTADAMHCQKTTARAILDRGGDYVLALEGNQPPCSRMCARCSTIPHCPRTISPRLPTATMAGSRSAGPRSSMMSPGWPGSTPGRVSRPSARSPPHARSTAGLRPPPATSCSPALCLPAASPRSSASTGRSRTACTGCSTLAMDEDRSRSRKDHAPGNLARLRRFALNLLRASPEPGSTRGKIKRAARDDSFRLNILKAA